MKKIQFLALLAVMLLSVGCAQQRRSVTHIRVQKDRAYVAYAEWDDGMFSFSGGNERSRVKHCAIQPDNSLDCKEDADVNGVLNPDEKGKPAAEPAAPAPGGEAKVEASAATP